ncbi:MAG: helix-turn-helix domain-containing protein [Bacteroidales bacterium]|nr:helix-turn-helix domain-containing protein [Bacteroidales bacterium]
MNGKSIFTEIPPIFADDIFVIFERRKTGFNFPIHVHPEYEINFISGARGAVRVVGDSVEEIGDSEMVLITGSNLEHMWKDGSALAGKEIYEVTIQFSPTLLEAGGLLEKKHFAPIKKMFQDGQNGIAFSDEAIRRSGVIIQQILSSSDGFNSFLLFLSLLNVMAHDDAYRVLSNSKFSSYHEAYDSRNIGIIMDFMNHNYHRKVTLEEAASLVNMSVPSFSRFIRSRTGFSFVNCLNNIRVGSAARILIDEPSETISSVAYRCGFNNLSNFNRIFKAKRGITPKEFRSYYKKNKIII